MLANLVFGAPRRVCGLDLSSSARREENLNDTADFVVVASVALFVCGLRLVDVVLSDVKLAGLRRQRRLDWQVVETKEPGSERRNSGLQVGGGGGRVGGVDLDDAAGSAQRRGAHQHAVDFARRLAALGDGPDDQRLAAAAVAGGEDALHRRGVAAGRRLDVAARVLVQLQFVDDVALGAEEAQRQQHQVAREDALAARHRVHRPASRRVLSTVQSTTLPVFILPLPYSLSYWLFSPPTSHQSSFIESTER